MLEFANLTEFPQVLNKIPMPLFSIAGNKISAIPLELFYVPKLGVLDLSGNPISKFPDIDAVTLSTRGPPALGLKFFDIAATNLSDLPSWMNDSSFKFIATKTPLCERISRDNLSSKEVYLTTFVDCTTWTNIGYGY